MKPQSKTALCTICILALAALSASASEPGNLMKMTITTDMQMPGVPNMAPMTRNQTVCTSANRPDPRQMMNRNKTCKVTHYQKSGNTISYQVTCSGEMQMHGDGKFTLLPNSGMHGVMHMAGAAGGQAMKMAMTIDGTRVGTCAYTPPVTH